MKGGNEKAQTGGFDRTTKAGYSKRQENALISQATRLSPLNAGPVAFRPHLSMGLTFSRNSIRENYKSNTQDNSLIQEYFYLYILYCLLSTDNKSKKVIL